MSKKVQKFDGSSAGFTIIELLIATVVFSMILILITYGVLQVSRTYYKGITTSRTQQTARSVMDQVSQAIQFGSTAGGATQAPPPPPNSTPTPQSFCMGAQRFSYILGYKLVDGVNHALVVDNSTDCTTPFSSLPSSAKELLAPNMRLSKFIVKPLGNNLYQVTVRIASGDDDLLSDPTGPNAACGGGAGSQFCAVSELSTIVQKRLN